MGCALKHIYQYNFSELHCEDMYNTEERKIKAEKTLSVIKDFFSNNNISTKSLNLLDIGCSTGFLTKIYSEEFREIVAIDIDQNAINYANNNNNAHNIKYYIKDSLNSGFERNSFDVITCTHIYEHVPDSKKLMGEIYRLLKPNGICYFAAGNRLILIEAHYKLPLLSIIPKKLAHRYLKLTGKGEYYYENHLTYWGLRKLVSNFQVIDYTKKIIKYPKRFNATDMLKPRSMKQIISLVLINFFFYLSPTYIWILKKGEIK